MSVYENAYDILSKKCVEFCEKNGSYYSDIVAEIYTDVLGHDYVLCICSDIDGFEFMTDWYEGGHLVILNMDYFDNVCRRAFKDPDKE